MAGRIWGQRGFDLLVLGASRSQGHWAGRRLRVLSACLWFQQASCASVNGGGGPWDRAQLTAAGLAPGRTEEGGVGKKGSHLAVQGTSRPPGVQAELCTRKWRMWEEQRKKHYVFISLGFNILICGVERLTWMI